MSNNAIRAPRRRGSANLLRSRLIDETLAFPATAKLLIVQAPAGFGKSIFLGELEVRLSNEGWKIGWMSGSTGLRGHAGLVRRLMVAMRRFPGVGASLEQIEIDSSFDQWRHLVDLLSLCQGRCALLIDDLEELFVPHSEKFLHYLLRNRPPVLGLALAGRGSIELPTYRERLSDTLLTIGPEQLAFDEQELGRYIGIEPKDDHMASVRQATGGWPALVRIHHDQMTHGPNLGEPGQRQVPDHRSFVREALLGGLNNEERELLRSCSVMTGVTAADCFALTGRSDSGRLLANLGRSGLLREAPSGTFAIVSTLRNLIVQHFAEFDLGQMRHVYRAAAEYLIAEHRYGEALGLGTEAASPDIIVDLLERSGWTLFQQSGHSALLRAMGAVPEQRLRAMPRLAILRAWCQLFAGDVHLVASLVQSWGSCPMDGDVFSTGHVRVLERCLAAHRETSDQDLFQGVREGGYGDDLFLKSLTLLHMGNVFRVQGALSRAIDTLQQCLDVADASISPFVSLSARIGLGQAYYLSGNLRAAVRVLDEALARNWRDAQREPILGALGHVLRAQAHFDLGQLNACESDLGVVDRLVSADFGGRTFGQAELLRAHLAWSMGDTAQAEHQLSTVRSVAIRQNSQRLLFLARLEEGRLLLAAGAIDRAEIVIRSAAEGLGNDISQPGVGDRLERYLIMAAQAEMARGSFGQARGLIDRGLQSATAAARFPNILALETLLALCWLQEGAESRALAGFETVFLRARRQGFQQVFIDLSLTTPIARLLRSLEAKWKRTGAFEEDRLELAPLFAAMGTRSEQMPLEELQVATNESFGRKDALMLFYLARGLKNREIADQMSLSVETVKWRLKLIYSKLYVRNRTEAISHARILGLIQ